MKYCTCWNITFSVHLKYWLRWIIQKKGRTKTTAMQQCSNNLLIKVTDASFICLCWALFAACDWTSSASVIVRGRGLDISLAVTRLRLSLIQWHERSHHHLYLHHHHCNSFANTFHSLETCIIPSEDRTAESLWEVCWALYIWDFFGSARLWTSSERVTMCHQSWLWFLGALLLGFCARAIGDHECEHCSRLELELCGGPDWTLGFCGSGLTCAALNRTGPARIPETGVCRGQWRAGGFNSSSWHWLHVYKAYKTTHDEEDEDARGCFAVFGNVSLVWLLAHRLVIDWCGWLSLHWVGYCDSTMIKQYVPSYWLICTIANRTPRIPC